MQAQITDAENAYGRGRVAGMAETSAVAKKLKELRRSFRVPVRELGRALRPPYGGPSGYTHYEDRFKGEFIPVEVMKKLAPIFLRSGVPLERLNELTGTISDAPPARVPENPPIDVLIPAARPIRPGLRTLPIYGAGQAGPHGFVNVGPQDAIEWTWMPPELQDVKGAFGLYVDGESMSDAGLPEGTEVHVHPHRKPRARQNCVIVLRSGGVFIKRYIGQRGGRLVYQQSNPMQEGEFPLEDVAAIYLITSATFT